MSDSLTARPERRNPLQAVRRTTVAEAVQAQLLQWIESGQIAVGDKLPSEHELAGSFDVSRPVVREALGSLRAMGVVSSRNGRGTFVTSSRSHRGLTLGGASTEELHEVRSHLEIPGVGLAARRRRPAQLAQLDRIIKAQIRRENPDAWVRLDVAFHVVLAEATGNPVQVQLIDALRELLLEQSYAVARISVRLAAATQEHEAIVTAVAEREAAGAEVAMANHLGQVREESLRLRASTTKRT